MPPGRRPLRRSVARGLAALAALTAAALPAQGDRRDRIVQRDGKQLNGRLVTPFAAGELLLVQGGRRIRVPRSEVLTSDLVADRVREFCARRLQHRDSRRAMVYLVDWAEQRELPGLARLQATWLLLTGSGDDVDDRLHEFLGHRRSGGAWLWPHGGGFLPRNQLDAALGKAPLRLVGERFAVRCDAGYLQGVAALLDLEHLGVVWFDTFGEQLGLQEVLRPIEVATFRNSESFPKWGFRPRPYYEPPPHADLGRTYYSGPAPERPDLLFFVGTQGLLYRTLIGETNLQDSRDRVCAWLEIGLGMWCQMTMQGPMGFAAPGPLRNEDLQALQALGRSYRLTHLLRLPMYGGFYLNDGTATATNWSAATMFVAWLLRDDNDPPTRQAFLNYVRAALGERLGDSSSGFDRIMGRRIEDFDEPWRKWLAKTAGF